MAWHRKIPFGYKMAKGEIVSHPEEADAVAFIYDNYRKGGSYLTIAKAMTERGVRYHEAAAEWNKHMVKRILENPKYAGLDAYPAIVTHKEWLCVQDKRDGKTAEWISQSICVELAKRRMFCGECGSAISKDTSARDGTRWWHCSNPECTVMLMMRDDTLEETVTALMNRLITSPELLDPREPAAPRVSFDAARMQNEINRELGKVDLNEEYLTSLILGCAAEKYALLDDGSEQRKIAWLKTELTKRSLLTAFDPALFSDVTDTLLVMADKTLALRIVGGNIISEIGKEHIKNADSN